MTLPRIKHIYLYKGKKYIVRYCTMIDLELIAQTIPESNKEYESSEFITFNYWEFLIFAKHIGEVKLSKAY